MTDSNTSSSRNGQLVLENVFKQFVPKDQAPPAVDGISLEINDGEFVTLLGPSGCGKTTLLRIVAGLESLTAGTVKLGGIDIEKVPPYRRPMSMVFQNYALFPHMNVRDNVSYGLRMRKESKTNIENKVDIILASMNLHALADRFPRELSGGQQQRVALARAMVMNPSVLLFDEPLSNLDAKLRDQMRNEIRLLQKRMGITSLYVTHDQAEAMSMSDRVVVMNRGKIEQIDTPGMVYSRPASVFVADFIGRATFLPIADHQVLDDGKVSLDVLGQQAIVEAHPSSLESSDVVLMIRPESVRVEAAHDGTNGVIVSTMYLGKSVEYEVDTKYGQILASVSDPDPSELLGEGTGVKVWFDEKRSYLLSRGPFAPEAPSSPSGD
ncbi:MAG: ABC transporter ATP-binding protein [Scrofimicrobium sp.]